jgi:hypothetical protein
MTMHYLVARFHTVASASLIPDPFVVVVVVAVVVVEDNADEVESLVETESLVVVEKTLGAVV